MNTIAPSHVESRAVPSADASTLYWILLAGGLATVAFDLFGQGVSPALGFASLAPEPLARNVLEQTFGYGTDALANIMHYLTGLILYPLGYLWVARPLGRRLGLPWPATATGYGVGLWVFALYLVAHLIAGQPPFLAFTGITWVALIGHVLFALVAAAVLERPAPAPAPAR